MPVTTGHDSIDGNFSFADISELLGADAYNKSGSSFQSLRGEGGILSSLSNAKKQGTISANEVERAKERKRLGRLKLLIVSTVILLAATVAILVYFGISQADHETSELAYLDYAERIRDVMENNLLNQLLAIESLAVHVTSYASGSESKFPFLKPIPDFELRPSRGGVPPSVVSLISYVTDADRGRYEEYIIRQRLGDSNNTQLDTPDLFPQIFVLDEKPDSHGVKKKVAAPQGSGPFFPVWLTAPSIADAVNLNMAGISLEWSIDIEYVMRTREALITNVVEVTTIAAMEELGFFEDLPRDEPHSNILYPLADESGEAVGVLSITFLWTSILNNILEGGDGGYVVELENACHQGYSFHVDGEVKFLGPGRLHDTRYNNFQYTFDLSSDLKSKARGALLIDLSNQECRYRVNVYPTASTVDANTSDHAIYYTLAVTFVFLLAGATFCCYGALMERRQNMILRSADEARALLSSMFPSQVRGRLLAHHRKVRGAMKKLKRLGKRPKNTSKKESDDKEPIASTTNGFHEKEGGSTNDDNEGATQIPRRITRLKTYLDGSSSSLRWDESNSRPIADTFPNSTILFADLVGFTSWCSLREPEKVFVLLESIFGAFDKIARHRKVFKVETIGDCYVCSTGVPDPQPDHAWRMAKFTLEIRHKLGQVLSDLDSSLGPDTSELSMRFGINTGMVTAGVLRTEKSRFQLFGDCINMASRMETTSESNRIQLSQSTADQLIEYGKSAWLRPRDELIMVKGKGLVQTWWLASRPKEATASGEVQFAEGDSKINTADVSTRRMCIESNLSDSERSSDDNDLLLSQDDMSTLYEVDEDLVDNDDDLCDGRPNEMYARKKYIQWHTDQLTKGLKRMMGNRRDGTAVDSLKLKYVPADGSLAIDEMVDVIPAKEVDQLSFWAVIMDPDDVEISAAVMAQLHDFVSMIYTMYGPSNKYHSFERSTHVSMSASMILNRILFPVDCDDDQLMEELSEHSYGINSDYLAQFAIFFAALVHDVDHPGVPNSELEKEDPHFAELYKFRCICEQKSIDLSWDLLNDSKYRDLRSCIYTNENELQRFRQLVVNCLMCLDSSDEELRRKRSAKWDKAFDHIGPNHLDDTDLDSLRATLLIETLVQVSDVAPAMQHWLVFKKWNELKFQEECDAWMAGRSPRDPAETWFSKELEHFEDHIIPLAKRLQSFKVLGGDEHLFFAQNNKEEWHLKGRDMVKDMKARFGTRESPSPDHHAAGSDTCQSKIEEQNYEEKNES